MGFTFYSDMFRKLSEILDNYWYSTASDVCSAIAPVAITMLIIYVCLWGIASLRGTISEPVTDAAGRLLRMSIITAIALNMGHYSGFLADMLWNSPDYLASIVAGGSSGTSAMGFLDQLMGQFYEVFQAYNDKAQAEKGITGIPNLGQLILGLLMLTAGAFVTGYAAFLFALSKVALALILCFGPIFILLTLFEATKRFFDMWIGQALNYVFLVMLVAGVLKLVLSLISAYMLGQNLTDISEQQAIPAIVFSIVAVLVMMQLPSVASALAGGVSIGTLGAVGWSYRKARGGLGASLNSVRPTKVRAAGQTIRAEARAAGSIYRRVTGGRK